MGCGCGGLGSIAWGGEAIGVGRPDPHKGGHYIFTENRLCPEADLTPTRGVTTGWRLDGVEM